MIAHSLRASLAEQAHVYTINLEQGKELSSSVRNRYESILSSDELDSCNRFHFERDRCRRLIAHANLRIVLSKYVDVDPPDWIFEYNRFGRPEIARTLGVSDLRFNISYSDDLLVILVNNIIDGGIDVERTDGVDDPMQLGQSVFSPYEIDILQRYQNDGSCRTRFFEYWTLKEAFVKARGVGLSVPLNQFSFSIDINNKVQIDFSSKLNNNPLTWQFLLEYPTSNHVIGVALRRGYHPDLSIILRNLII
ncbi:MAG: 4'-phosphopantetheinyl transferase superfamily protein [Thermodesulfobacteriota bacterium]